MELHETEEYQDALRKVMGWKKRLSTADKTEALKVLEEKKAFFGMMRRESPRLYEVFRINDKELSELAMKRISGTDSKID
jgi:hypothetical protein